MTRWVIALIVPIWALLSLPSCRQTPAPPVEKRHALRGEVIRLEEKEKVAVIKHEEIQDFMDAMTMGFPVPEADQWAKLRPGMRLTGTVVERQHDYYLTGIQEEPAPASGAEGKP